MNYSEQSSFAEYGTPEAIMILNDVSIWDLPSLNHFNELLAKGDYAAASNFIRNDCSFDSLNASLFNYIQNCIVATQEYIYPYPDGYFLIDGEWKRPFEYHVSEPTPTQGEITIWIDDEIADYK